MVQFLSSELPISGLTDRPISFPGLFGDWEFNPNPIAIPFPNGGGIRWYAICICAGLILAVLFCCRQSKKYGIAEDHVYDMMIWQIPLCIVGARVFYVLFALFRPDDYTFRTLDGRLKWGEMVAVWKGGLAIYGAVITAFFVLLVFCKKRKLSFGSFADLGVMGLLIGQAVGRWGNFFNREVFGRETTLPWRMGLWVGDAAYIEVHPTFLYESVWNLIGLALIVFVISKRRTFDGENTCFYFMWYGAGRAWLETIRTDYLPFFGLELFGQPVRAFRLLSIVLAITALIVLVVNKRKHPHGQEALFVNRQAAMKAAAEAALEAETEA